jgi:hypothetical protein
MSTEIATQEPKKAVVPFGTRGIQLSNMDDAYRFAVAVSKSGFAPKGMESPESIFIAIQFGAELGLTPMASLQSLAIINGRPAIYGDGALALVRSNPSFEDYTQTWIGEGDAMKAIVTVKRKGEKAIAAEFSVADAKKAQLWGKAGPWTQYPARMLMWRARGFALRDAFGDVLRGLSTVEEVEDIEPTPRVMKPVFDKKKPEGRIANEPGESLKMRLPQVEIHEVGAPMMASSTEAALENNLENAGKLAARDVTDAALLHSLIEESGLKFADFVPVLHGSRMCAKNAESIEDLTDLNVAKFIADFDVISAATKSEKAP